MAIHTYKYVCLCVLGLLLVCNGTSCFIALARNESMEKVRILFVFNCWHLRQYASIRHLFISCCRGTTQQQTSEVYVPPSTAIYLPALLLLLLFLHHTTLAGFHFQFVYMRIVFFIYSFIYLFNCASCGYLATHTLLCMCAHLFMCGSGFSYLSFACVYSNAALKQDDSHTHTHTQALTHTHAYTLLCGLYKKMCGALSFLLCVVVFKFAVLILFISFVSLFASNSAGWLSGVCVFGLPRCLNFTPAPRLNRVTN